MPNPIVRGESADLFDQETGEHVGVIDLFGREQLGLNAAQQTALGQLVGPSGEWAASYPFELAAISAGVLAANRVRFYAPFTHSIVPALGATPTHSRNCVGTVVDCYGVMHPVLANEVRFHGARRVANLIADSEGFTTGWSVAGGTTRTAVADREGLVKTRRNVRRFVVASGQTALTKNSQAYRPGPHAFSVGLSGDGATEVRIRIERSSDSATVAEINVTPTTAMQRYALAGTITDTSNHRIVLYVMSGSGTFYLSCAQTEYGTLVPNEYISNGVAGGAAPFNGANVDGVRYFPYYRPTTLDATTSIVSEELRGDQIPASVLLGLIVENNGNSNKWYSSRDPGAAQWTLSGVSAGGLRTCNLLGYESLRKIIENGATSLHRTSQTWRSSGNANGEINSVSAYVQKGERDWAVVGLVQRDTTTEIKAWFNLATGTVGTVTGTDVEAFIYPEGDCWRVGISGPTGTGATDVVGFFGIAGADGVESYAGDSASGHWFGACQIEESDAPSNYTGDSGTSSLIARVNESCTMAMPATVPTTEWTISTRQAMRGKVAQANKSNWWYLWYFYLDANNRGGLTIRPGVFGGGDAARQNDFAYDYYPNSATPDIEQITSGVDLAPLTPFKAVCRFSREAFRDSSSLGMSINGLIGANNPTGPTTTPIAAGVVTLFLSQQGSTNDTSRKSNAMCRDFAVYDYGMTDAELLAASVT